MKRTLSRGIVLTALAVLAISGPAAAFTPVPIPTPRIGGSTAATLMPISAPAHTSAAREHLPCVGTCKPAAAFDHAAVLILGGGAVRASGPITCVAGDIVRIRATVSQGRPAPSLRASGPSAAPGRPCIGTSPQPSPTPDTALLAVLTA